MFDINTIVSILWMTDAQYLDFDLIVYMYIFRLKSFEQKSSTRAEFSQLDFASFPIPPPLPSALADADVADCSNCLYCVEATNLG